MCGIFGMISAGISKANTDTVPILKALVHRGPDANGVAILEGCLLAHTRLSIIDLDAGSQPMTSIDGRYTITYNGEIYNFRILKNDLERLGYRFRTSSDTEVILAAYQEWDVACLGRFRGMFALAIWDKSERVLFAARDLFGEKPLYFAQAEKKVLLLASELKAILASKLLEPKLDLTSVDAYLAFGYVPPDRTIYANIQTLPPGHYLLWKDGTYKTTRYWQPCLIVQPIALHDAIERTRELLQQAVTRQMVADVPVGAFLSGGLDSSTIVALMQHRSSRPIKTFSVGFGTSINELPYARAVADKYRTDHHEIDLGRPDVAGMLERMAEVYDEPFADTSSIPTYLISEFARKHVKVVLSGDGGDELFGGYNWTYPALVQSAKVPDSMLLWFILRSLSKVLRHRWKSLALYSAGCGLAVRRSDMWSRQVMQHIQIKQDERKCLWGGRIGGIGHYHPHDYYRSPDVANEANQGFYFDLMSYLPGDILVKVDRAAMAHGLETRAPFLDRDLAEFAFSLPMNLKVDGWKTKVLLQEACSGYWPAELKGRDKRGFGSPVGDWLRLPSVKSLADNTFSVESPLRALLPGINEMYDKNNNYKTWILLTLGLWLQRNKITV